MDLDLEKFSYRLTILLEEKNMSQTQLAKIIGTSNVTICRYLTCERVPRLDVITKIAAVFNVSLDYLLCLSDDKKTNDTNKTSDIDIALLVQGLFSLDKNTRLSKSQIALIKKILLANKDFIMSA